MLRIFSALLAVSFLVGNVALAQSADGRDAALMTRLFGNYDAQQHWSIWQPATIPEKYRQYFEGGRGRTSIAFDKTLRAEHKRYVVLSTLADGGGFQGCHACQVLLSALVFRAGTSVPEIREDFLMDYGQTGQAPEILLRRLGREHVALEFTQDYCMGGTCEGSLFLFGEVKGHLRQILALRSDNDDSDLNICSDLSKEDGRDCQSDPPYCFGKTDSTDAGYRENCTSWVGSLTVLAPQQEHGWSDLLFTQRVKAARPGAFTRRYYRTRFRFGAKEYKPSGTPSNGPSIDIGYYSGR